MYYTVVIGFRGLTIPQKIQRARMIISKLSNSQYFPGPFPSLVDLTDGVTKLETAHEVALDGGKTLKATMHDAEESLVQLFTSLAGHIQSVSMGSREKILSSGFDVKNPPGSSVEAQAVTGLSAERGRNEGECHLYWDAQENIRVYIVEISADGLTSWTECGKSSKSSLLVTGLVSNSKQFFRVSAFGTTGAGPYSDVVQGKVE